MSESVGKVFVWSGKLYGVESFMDCCDGLHYHAEPGQVVKDGVRGVVG